MRRNQLQKLVMYFGAFGHGAPLYKKINNKEQEKVNGRTIIELQRIASESENKPGTITGGGLA